METEPEGGGGDGVHDCSLNKTPGPAKGYKYRDFDPSRPHLQGSGFSDRLGGWTSRRSPLLNQMMESYTDCGGIKHVNGTTLPSKMAVAALTQDLLQIIFPGFISEKPIADLLRETDAQLRSLEKQLKIEIAKSLVMHPVAGQDAETATMAFLRKLPDVRCLVQTDVEAAFQGDPAAASKEEVVLAYPGIEAIAVFRMAHVLYQLGVAFLPRMMTEWAHSRTGIDLHPGAEIGTHFFIDHGTGVVIGGTSKIGNRVRLYQGVGLVARSLAKHVERDEQGHALGGKRHPTVGDDVTIYANSTIVGGDTVIGDRTIVGGNVWVTRSIPPDSIALYEAQQLSIHPKHRSTGDWVI